MSAWKKIAGNGQGFSVFLCQLARPSDATRALASVGKIVTDKEAVDLLGDEDALTAKEGAA
jgi:hypothetical protein